MAPPELVWKFRTLVSTFENWPLVALDKAGLGGVLEYRTRAGVAVRCRARTTDVNEAVVVLSGHEYPEGFLQVPRGGLILDLGANIGTFSLACAAANAHHDFRVVAVEPLPDNVVLLRQNLMLNGLTNVDVYEAAVASADGSRRLRLDTDADSASLTDREECSLEVRAMSLRGLFGAEAIEFVDLLKMDIEGAEYEVIEAAAPFIADHVGRLLVEYHPHPQLDGRQRIIELLEGPFDVKDLHRRRDAGVLVLSRRSPAS